MASAALRARWAARAAAASVLFNTVDASDLPEELDLKPATNPDPNLDPDRAPSRSPPPSPSCARPASPDTETPVGRFAFPTLGLGVLGQAVEEAAEDEGKEDGSNSRLSLRHVAASHVDAADYDTRCSGLKTVSGGTEDINAEEESEANPSSPLASPVRPEGLLAFRHRRLVRRVTTSSRAAPASCTKTPATLVEGEAGGEDEKNANVRAVTVTLRNGENETRRPARKILQSASLERPRSARVRLWHVGWACLSTAEPPSFLSQTLLSPLILTPTELCFSEPKATGCSTSLACMGVAASSCGCGQRQFTSPGDPRSGHVQRAFLCPRGSRDEPRCRRGVSCSVLQ